MITQPIINLVKRHEGCSLTVYTDTRGFGTAGWGHKLSPGESYPNGITQLQADMMLLADLADAEAAGRRLIVHYDNLNEVRQGVVVDMCFNLGLHGFSEFTHTIAALNAGNWQAAANAMQDSAWYNQVKDRAIEDCALIVSGEWPCA